MLQGLFCHDGPIYIDSEGNIYDTALTNQVFSRYLSIVDVLNIAIRTRTAKDVNRNTMSQNTLKNINIVPVPNLLSVEGQVFAKRKAKSIIEESVKKSDVIFVRQPGIIGAYAIKFAKKYKKPYMVEVVGCPWDAFWNHSIKGKLMAPFMFLLTKNIIKESPFTLYVTNEFLQRRYPCKGKTISCSDVELQSLDESIMERRLNKISNMTKNNPIVLGTIAAVNVRYKGQQYVIEAISRLNKQGYNFEYHLLGSGDSSFLKSVAERHGVAEKVKFLGSMPHEKVFEYLDNIDIYIQPSRQEGLPRAVIEAMSRGCPVLGSTTGGIPELLNKEFIFRNGAVNEICTLLKKLDKEMMQKEAKRSFEKAKEYDKDILNRKRNAFYKEFISNSNLQ